MHKGVRLRDEGLEIFAGSSGHKDGSITPEHVQVLGF